MDAAPYYAPTYFPADYFYSSGASTSVSSVTGQLPYNAPTYFAPAYFYGPAATTSVTGQLPYNAPTYFAPSYFYGPAATTTSDPITPDPPPVPCDEDSYLALLGLLNDTGVFEDVIFGAATRRGQAGADTYPLAVLTPEGWEESDDYDPTSIVRRVTFSITVVVKSEDDLPQYDELNRLACAIKRAVDGSDLDGNCLPALTRIRSARYSSSDHYPEQSLDLEGEFSTIIDPTAKALVPT